MRRGDKQPCASHGESLVVLSFPIAHLVGVIVLVAPTYCFSKSRFHMYSTQATPGQDALPLRVLSATANELGGFMISYYEEIPDLQSILHLHPGDQCISVLHHGPRLLITLTPRIVP